MKSPEEMLPIRARDLYEVVRPLPIVSPHGHCDPAWWADNAPFPDPASLLIVPDHYVFRMLYSHGVKLADLGIGVPAGQRNPRRAFQIFADHWHCFLGTPSREWLEYTLHQILGVQTELSGQTAQKVFDEISEKLSDPRFRPRALFDSFNIELLATTDVATDQLKYHQVIRNSDWNGRIIPSFRPDSVLNPERPDFAGSVNQMMAQTGGDLSDFASYLDALRHRRAYFKAQGCTATDHDLPFLSTVPLSRSAAQALFAKALTGTLTTKEARQFYGHMLIEMAGMSIDDGLVMQLHAGSARNTNPALFNAYGPDMGADIPRRMNWLDGLAGLLGRYGDNPDLRVILFTLDEATYSRELGPMAGHWPCLRIGPPWWFHDSVNGIQRYLDAVVETAGYFNLAGFNDDTRAFLSIPARHNTWRRTVAEHLAAQVERGKFSQANAEMLAIQLCRDLALDTYRLNAGDLP